MNTARLVALIATVIACLITSSQGCSVIVEKGQGAWFTCNVPTTVASGAWQLREGNTLFNFSTCNFVNNTCTDTLPTVYTGAISISGTTRLMTLKIIGARVNETHFSCVLDNGQSGDCQAEVYAWPVKPVCSQTVTDSYVDYTCTTTNVFPSFHALLHRRETDFVNGDTDSNYTQCSLGAYGSGSEGDYSGSCTFRIPLSKMKLNSTVYMQMSSFVSNETLVNKPAAVSDDIVTILSVPTVGIYLGNCPVGPGVNGQSVLTGTIATCKCVLATNGLPQGFARWFDKNGNIIGTENTIDRSSTITFSDNSSDPNQLYECWPWTPLPSAAVSFLRYTPSFRCSYKTVEKGQSTNIQCPVLNTVSSITWQLLSGNSAVNISTCSLLNNKCNNLLPYLYNGFIISSGGHKIAGLIVSGARTNETQFSYLTEEDGTRSRISELQVYAWPKKPNCVQAISNSFVQVTCSTDNVYPTVVAVLHRRVVDFTSADFDLDYTDCTYGAYGSGSEGDYTASCTWRIPMGRMFPESSLYVEMSSSVTIDVNKASAVSDDLISELSVPEIVVYSRTCPVGPGVQGDSIQIGTTATCKCELAAAGFPPGFARWLTADRQIVGVENATDFSSTLTLAYNSSDPKPSYQCWPITPLITTLNITIYSPTFVSSTSP